MHGKVVQNQVLTRRAVATGLGAVAAFVAQSGRAAKAAMSGGAPAFAEALARALNGARPADGPITLDIPEYAENGMMVSYTVAVDSPMSATDFVRAIHLLSSQNIKPVLSVFRFSPASAKAIVSGRIRLAKSQKVYALAELSDGRFLLRERMVNVTVGSCG